MFNIASLHSLKVFEKCLHKAYFNNKRWRWNSAGKMIQTCLKEVEKYEFNKVAILTLLKLGVSVCFGQVDYFICGIRANVQCLKNEMNIHTSTFRTEKLYILTIIEAKYAQHVLRFANEFNPKTFQAFVLFLFSFLFCSFFSASYFANT